MNAVNKKIIIIGATSGIGRKLAELYAEKGYILGISGRRKELLDEIQNQFPEQIFTECFDVMGNENSKHLHILIEKLGGLDILIYCSGIGEPSKELDWAMDDRIVRTNVNGFTEITNRGFNYFIKQGHGSLVTISSVASLRGNSWVPAYSASKAFQNNYFEGLSIKAKRMKKNIAITCIIPGFVNTRMIKGNKTFWALPVEKAAKRIITAIEKKKRRSYLSLRWWLVAQLMRLIPYQLFKKIL